MLMWLALTLAESVVWAAIAIFVVLTAVFTLLALVLLLLGIATAGLKREEEPDYFDGLRGSTVIDADGRAGALG